jgi:hypothetical protein
MILNEHSLSWETKRRRIVGVHQRLTGTLTATLVMQFGIVNAAAYAVKESPATGRTRSSVSAWEVPPARRSRGSYPKYSGGGQMQAINNPSYPTYVSAQQEKVYHDPVRHSTRAC